MCLRKLFVLVLCAFAWSAAVADGLAYTKKAGRRVETFENKTFNYRLQFPDKRYTYTDLSGSAPDASFAAFRLIPNVYALVIADKIGAGVPADTYSEVATDMMKDRVVSQQGAEFKDQKTLGKRTERGMEVFQALLTVDIDNAPVVYVMSTIVDGGRGYQLLTFAEGVAVDKVVAEADYLVNGFSIIDHDANIELANASKAVTDYRSETFGYRFQAKGHGWFSWSDVAEDYDGADLGAWSSRGYSAAVLPLCWDGSAPPKVAIFKTMMQQFGENYPSTSGFIVEERDISKDEATGKLLIGVADVDGDSYRYYYWIVADARCAYTLAAWGPENDADAEDNLAELWRDFRLTGEATALAGKYVDMREQAVNAHLANALGLHFNEARSYRDAFRLFAQASDLQPDYSIYLQNSMHALSAINAYEEALQFLKPRLDGFASDRAVRSWHAWLSYRTGDAATARAVYAGLFADGYRDDEDFSTYMSALADDEQWDAVDEQYAVYTSTGSNRTVELLWASLLKRRGRHEDAIQLLDDMAEGRPFEADLAYERLSVLDEMQRPAEILKVADELIAEGYQSLQSYFYKGDAEYQLRSYRKARESFKKALEYAPANPTIRDYLSAIDNQLGEGDTSIISNEIPPVAMPEEVRQRLAADHLQEKQDGYGAVYLSRVTGYEFDAGDTLLQTQFQRIHVLDNNGVTQFSTLEFDFDPAFEQLFVNQLLVRNADGDVVGEGDIATYYITNSESGFEASTERTVNLPVPSVAPGVVIEAVVSKRTAVEDGTFPLESLYFSSDRPVGYRAVFVEGKHKNLNHRRRDLPPPRELGKALVWESENPVVYRWEPMQPGFDQILPILRLGTADAGWAESGTGYLNKIHDKLDVSSVADRAQRLVEGVRGRDRQIEILSAFVQEEISYKALEFGRRAYIPKTARKTLRDRYGDCKDHAVLLYALLQSAGIEASLALVNLNNKVLSDLPTTDQFDHMIVAVETDAGLVYIDPTDKDLHLGQLSPRMMAGNYALVLSEQPTLLKIPEYASDLTGLSIERTVTLRGTESILAVSETARFSGYQAAELRGQLRGIETSETKVSLQRWLSTRYADAELVEYFVESVFDPAYDLVIEMQYTIPIDADGSFDLPGFVEAEYLDSEFDPSRRFPFEYSAPLRISSLTSLQAPPGRRLDALSGKPDGGESKFGNWKREVSQNGDHWEFRFDFVASESRFDADDYRGFAEFQRQAVDAIEQPFVLN